MSNLRKSFLTFNGLLIFNHLIKGLLNGTPWIGLLIWSLPLLIFEYKAYSNPTAKVYQIYGFNTQVLAASIRSSLHIVKCAEVGADVVTCPASTIHGLFKHPLTDIGLDKFLADHAKLNK